MGIDTTFLRARGEAIRPPDALASQVTRLEVRGKGGGDGGSKAKHYTVDGNFDNYVTAFPGHNSTGDLDATPGRKVYIAKPWYLRALASRDGKTYDHYVHEETQTRLATRNDGVTEVEIMIPKYVIGDMIRAIPATTGVTRPRTDSDPPTPEDVSVTLEDTNCSGRGWGRKNA